MGHASQALGRSCFLPFFVISVVRDPWTWSSAYLRMHDDSTFGTEARFSARSFRGLYHHTHNGDLAKGKVVCQVIVLHRIIGKLKGQYAIL